MMAEEHSCATDIVEYRLPDGELVACVLVDYLSDGLSMVYSFFSPELRSRGLGNFMILDHIRRTQDMNLAYLYLGYWVEGSPKMDYKIRFKPNEVLGSKGWQTRDISE